MNEDRATRYQRLRRSASLGSAVLTGLLMAALVVSGGATFLRQTAVSLSLEWQVPAVAIFVAAIHVLHECLLLPLAHYQGVTLEHRYGLSTQSPAQWWLDYAKASLLRFTAVMVAGVGVSQLLRWTPTWWWVFTAAGFTVILVLLTRIAPVLLPMLDASEPLGRQELVGRLLALANRANTRVLGVFEWHLGASTKKANAALTGIGRTRRILVSDTLLAEHSDDEIEVILAHELAHHVYHDIWTSIGMHALVIAAAAFAADRLLGLAAGSFGLNGKTDVAALPLLVLACGAVSLLLMPLANAVSRAQERRADRYALEMTHNAPAFVSAMKRLGAQHLSDDRPSLFVEFAFYTHPPVGARISAAQAWADGAARAVGSQQ